MEFAGEGVGVERVHGLESQEMQGDCMAMKPSLRKHYTSPPPTHVPIGRGAREGGWMQIRGRDTHHRRGRQCHPLWPRRAGHAAAPRRRHCHVNAGMIIA